MTRLEDLIYSLATVLVRYHDSQKVKVKLIDDADESIKALKSRKLAISIINHTQIQFDEKLKDLISICTNGYPDRQHFLTYLLNEISVLKSLSDKTKPLDNSELERCQAIIVQMITQFKQLLLITKNETCSIKYSTFEHSKESTELTLNGLINTAYLGSHFCNSGILLNLEVLNRLHITEKSAHEDIHSCAVDIITEYQNALKAQYMDSLEGEVETSKIALEQLQVQHTEKITYLTQQLDANKLLMTSLDEELGKLRSKNSELRHDSKLLEKERKIKELEGQVTGLKADLERLQSTTPRITASYNPLIFGGFSARLGQQSNPFTEQTTPKL